MENSYIDGLFVFKPHERAASFVKAKLSIKPEMFIKWLEDNKGKVNDKGFLAIDVLESKKGDWYGKLDTWKRTESTGNSTPSEEIDESLIPF